MTDYAVFTYLDEWAQVFDTLDEAREYAHSIVLYEPQCQPGDDYVLITDNDTEEVIDTLYETDATDALIAQYYSPEAIAERDRQRRLRAAARNLRLRKAVLKPAPPAYHERYDLQSDGSLRLKPQFR